MAVVYRGPLNVRLFLDTETGRYDYEIGDFRVSAQSRRKIAKAAEYLTDFYDRCFKERVVEVILSVVRLMLVSFILGWAITKIIPVWWLRAVILLALGDIVISLAILSYNRATTRVARKILKKQQAVSLELSIMLRKDLARFSERASSAGISSTRPSVSIRQNQMPQNKGKANSS